MGLCLKVEYLQYNPMTTRPHFGGQNFPENFHGKANKTFSDGKDKRLPLVRTGPKTIPGSRGMVADFFGADHQPLDLVPEGLAGQDGFNVSLTSLTEPVNKRLSHTKQPL